MSCEELAMQVACGKRRYVDIALTTCKESCEADIYYDGSDSPNDFWWPVNGCDVRVEQLTVFLDRRHMVLLLFAAGAKRVRWIDVIKGQIWSFTFDDLDVLIGIGPTARAVA